MSKNKCSILASLDQQLVWWYWKLQAELFKLTVMHKAKDLQMSHQQPWIVPNRTSCRFGNIKWKQSGDDNWRRTHRSAAPHLPAQGLEKPREQPGAKWCAHFIEYTHDLTEWQKQLHKAGAGLASPPLGRNAILNHFGCLQNANHQISTLIPTNGWIFSWNFAYNVPVSDPWGWQERINLQVAQVGTPQSTAVTHTREEGGADFHQSHC